MAKSFHREEVCLIEGVALLVLANINSSPAVSHRVYFAFRRCVVVNKHDPHVQSENLRVTCLSHRVKTDCSVVHDRTKVPPLISRRGGLGLFGSVNSTPGHVGSVSDCDTVPHEPSSARSSVGVLNALSTFSDDCPSLFFILPPLGNEFDSVNAA